MAAYAEAEKPVSTLINDFAPPVAEAPQGGSERRRRSFSPRH
jgi:hypothetical protein